MQSCIRIFFTVSRAKQNKELVPTCPDHHGAGGSLGICAGGLHGVIYFRN